MIRAALLAVALSASGAGALEIGESDFVYSSDLVAQGFTPFATSQAGNATFGMTNGRDLYLCFIADTGPAQNQRQSTLLAELAGETPDRTVPNIPVVCILTQ